ncbi:hypothetical protein TNCV_1779681 [Trichonephila clavipes]|nr:hypothetical protein TNCV_1779681 [Trichonephila clavipes]
MTRKWSPKSPNWPPTWSPKMMPTWCYRQDFAKFSLNRHYNAQLCGNTIATKTAFEIPSSGNADTLLGGGRTALSAFKLTLDIHKKPDEMCNINKSEMTTVLEKCSVII